MSYVYKLAGEDLEIAEADLKGFLKSQGVDENLEKKGRLAFTKSEPSQLRRLALTHEIGELLYRGELLEFDAELSDGDFKVRAEIIEKEAGKTRKEVEETLGSEIESENRKVNLENPDNIFLAYVFSDEIIITEQVLDIDRSLYEDRSNEKRAYSSPVSLDPVLARFMVNLTELEPGKYVFDPFCGTGGILIEAGLCGIGVEGADISEEMVEGCRKNLEEYGIINHDIREMSVEKSLESFDNYEAIVTDLPYGKASRKEGNPVETFLKFLKNYDGRAVFCYDEPTLNDYKSEYEIYVHKNLKRYIYFI